jgi:serine/threonine protein kinase
MKSHGWTHDKDENYVYLVLELCENGELARFLKQSATLFSENEARTVFQQVAHTTHRLP